MPDLIFTVSDLLREAAETYVMPVFGKQAANPKEKSPGEWVTEADKACEVFLERALQAVIPGSFVVGEEAATANPKILDRLISDGSVWLIDPLDGTSNFARGISPFAVMVALLRDGDTVASWILDPVSNQLAVAEKGAGSWINNEPIKVSENSSDLNLMKGAVLRRFLPPELAKHIMTIENSFANVSLGSKCAGNDYSCVARGAMDFVLYWRTLPWDHAPGVLFLEEAGGVATRPDGSAYRAADHSKSGLLVARNRETWAKVKSTLFD